jgi:hypothetical protein
MKELESDSETDLGRSSAVERRCANMTREEIIQDMYEHTWFPTYIDQVVNNTLKPDTLQETTRE